MSRMSEAHQDLESIHNILLGQRQVAANTLARVAITGTSGEIIKELSDRVQTINNLLLEIEAAGVVWPDNVVEADFGKCWPKEL